MSETHKILSEEEKDNKDAYLRGVKTQKKSSLVVLIISVVLALLAGGGIGAGIAFSITNGMSDNVESLKAVEEMINSTWLYKSKYKDKMDDVFNKLITKGNLQDYGDPYTAFAPSMADLGLSTSWTGVYGYSSHVSSGKDEDGNTYGGQKIVFLQDGTFKAAGAQIGDLIIACKKPDEDSYTYFDDCPPEKLSDLVNHKKEGDVLSFILLREGKKVEIEATKGNAKKITVIKKQEDGENKNLVLRIDSFLGNNSSDVYNTVSSYIDTFITDYGHINKLVLDCTSNGGGYTYDGYMTASMFVNGGSTIYTNRDYDGNILDTHKQNGKSYGTDKISDIGIILNSGSASATELFSNGLKENGRAKIFGTKSYGKGVEQNVYDNTKGIKGSLKVTSDYVYTPNGNCIHGVGITPDEYTATGDNDYYSYINQLVSYPYIESSYRLTYQQEKNVLESINKLEGYESYSTYSSAVSAFQTNQGIDVTGQYDTKTLYRLYGELYSKYEQGQQKEISLALQGLDK